MLILVIYQQKTDDFAQKVFKNIDFKRGKTNFMCISMLKSFIVPL